MTADILRKKIKNDPTKSDDDASRGAVKALQTAVSRTFHKAMGTMVNISDVKISEASLAEFLDQLTQHALPLVTEGPKGGMGAFAFSNTLVSMMVEIMTVGCCKEKAPPERRASKTEAAMLSPMVDMILTGTEANLEEHIDLIWAGGFRYSSFADGVRTLGLIIDDIPYRVLSLNVSMVSNPSRCGQLWLALPAEGQGRQPSTPGRQSSSSESEKDEFKKIFADSVKHSESELTAVLSKIKMPLSEVMDLKVNHQIALPDADVRHISVEGIDGRPIFKAKLGQNRNMRAICLTKVVSSNDFTTDILKQWEVDGLQRAEGNTQLPPSKDTLSVEQVQESEILLATGTE